MPYFTLILLYFNAITTNTKQNKKQIIQIKNGNIRKNQK
jgi:hypothetical protein